MSNIIIIKYNAKLTLVTSGDTTTLTLCFTLTQAPDKAPGQASWWRRRRREGDQGTSVLPLDRLGPSGEAGDSAALQTQNCQ